MKKRLLAIALVLAMTLTLMPTTVLAFNYPGEYWALQKDWENAVAAQDVNKTISVVQQTYDLLNPYGLVADVCSNLEPKCARAAWCSEIKGDLSGAITWLKRQRAYAQALNRDLTYIDAKISVLEAANSPAIYALTSEPGTAYAGSGAATSGTLYGSATDGVQSGNESATLMYLDFNPKGESMQHWIDFYKGSSSVFQKIINQGGVIEVAWNFTPQSTAGAQAVLNATDYINTSLKALGNLTGVTVLLRLGAEMNLWCDASVYKQAFQKVAKVAHNYSNIKMVFSPNDLAPATIDFTSFYPGDSYVDWIGMSTYHNSNYKPVTGGDKTTPSYSYGYSYNASYECAYWNEGFYDDPVQAIKPIVEFAKNHKKPVMISECGFGYKNLSTGADQTAYAKAQLTRFYSYVNMVYPQVKAVFYFNTNSDKYNYALSGSATLKKTYEDAIKNNGGYLSFGSSSTKTWKQLSQLTANQPGSIKLATYAPLPVQNSSTTCSVTYYVDGAQKSTVTEAPYYYTARLPSGPHTIRAVVTSGQFTVSSQTYTVNVDNPDYPFYDVAPDAYYANAVNWALSKSITSGMDKTHFGPDLPCTRGQIVTFLWNAAGKPQPKTTNNPFVDVKSSDYFYKAVLWAVENGITAGKDAAHFAPDDPCTRAQAVSFLYRNAKSPAASATNKFSDVASTDYFASAVAWAVSKEITAGTTATTFSPHDTCTRAQIVSFLYRQG